MIFALIVVVVSLSLPTIMHLSALLKQDPRPTAGGPVAVNYGD